MFLWDWWGAVMTDFYDYWEGSILLINLGMEG